MLRDFLLIRRLALRRIKWVSPTNPATPYKAALEDLVERVRAMGDRAPPIQAPEANPIGDGRYVVWDMICTDNVVQWHGLVDGEKDAVLDTIRADVRHINDDYIDSVFGLSLIHI